ncbi:MAG TPA: GTPase HflX [Tissierellales bacterium]|nr:GTPase HflX [Tissierellales bacterium]
MLIYNKISKEKVLIVGVELIDDPIDIDSSMEELSELVKAAYGEVVAQIVQKRATIDSAFFIGKGKVEEISSYCNKLDIDTVVFNDELSGAQLRNLEDIINRKIVDRTNLILDIFANRATTKEGKLQVKLAQLNYRLPRLVGFRDYLSREGGGIGTRGPGEQKLETDRRHILREINNIEKELKSIEKRREVTRKRRLNSKLPMVALVGYTNAGKSTLLNKIIEKNEDYDVKKRVFVYDMLFATLDTAFRRGTLPNGQDFLITDTVGFVSKLPTNLIEAFKGTLEEVQYADVILHVVDASNKDLDIQLKTTYNILKELEVLNKPIITVFNKIDKVNIDGIFYENNYIDNKVFISATKNKNLEELLEMIEKLLPQKFTEVTLQIPYDKQDILAYICDNYDVEKLEYLEYGSLIKVSLNQIDYERYKAFEKIR